MVKNRFSTNQLREQKSEDEKYLQVFLDPLQTNSFLKQYLQRWFCLTEF